MIIIIIIIIIIQHPEEGHREDEQVSRSPDWVPETIE